MIVLFHIPRYGTTTLACLERKREKERERILLRSIVNVDSNSSVYLIYYLWYLLKQGFRLVAFVHTRNEFPPQRLHVLPLAGHMRH